MLMKYMDGSRLSGTDIAFDSPADFDEGDAILPPQIYLEDHSGDPAQLVESANFSQVKGGALLSSQIRRSQ